LRSETQALVVQVAAICWLSAYSRRTCLVRWVKPRCLKGGKTLWHFVIRANRSCSQLVATVTATGMPTHQGLVLRFRSFCTPAHTFPRGMPRAMRVHLVLLSLQLLSITLATEEGHMRALHMVRLTTNLRRMDMQCLRFRVLLTHDSGASGAAWAHLSGCYLSCKEAHMPNNVSGHKSPLVGQLAQSSPHFLSSTQQGLVQHKTTMRPSSTRPCQRCSSRQSKGMVPDIVPHFRTTSPLTNKVCNPVHLLCL
jgi:hypothetical protein